jgi:hypothetical protein
MFVKLNNAEMRLSEYGSPEDVHLCFKLSNCEALLFCIGLFP